MTSVKKILSEFVLNYPLRFLSWQKLGLFVVGLVLIGTSFDLSITLKLYYARPDAFQILEEGVVASYLLPKGFWYLFVLWMDFLGGASVILASCNDVTIRFVGVSLAILIITTPLLWVSSSFKVFPIFPIGWLAIPLVKYLLE